MVGPPLSPADETARCVELARIFDAMSDPIRLRILRELYRRDCRVAELGAVTGRQQQAVTHHLTRLKLQEMVQFRGDWKAHLYSLTPKGRAVIEAAAKVA